MAEPEPVDPAFFERADAFIDLANAQLQKTQGSRVSASMAFGSARFNAWLCGNMYGSRANMAQMKDQAVAGLTEHYRQMLNDSFDEFIANFDDYIKPGVVTRPVDI